MNRLSHLQILFPPQHKRVMYGVFTLLWASGALWLVFHYFLRVPGEFGLQAHALESWWLRLHGLAGFASLIALGSVLPVHARRAWQSKKNRASGLSMKILFLWLTLTGYALYYFTSEANEAWLPLLHWVVGLALPLLLVFHIRRGRAQRRVSHKPASAHG